MKERVRVGTWWELEAANGERAVEYDATCEGFGPLSMAARRFDGTDFEPTRCLDGRVYEDGLSEIDRVKAQHADRGPFKVLRVTRYRLVEARPCFSCEKAPQKYKTGLCEACHVVVQKASKAIRKADW